MTRLKFKHPNKRFTHVLALKKKFKTTQTSKAWPILSAHVLMSSVFTFRFFFW